MSRCEICGEYIGYQVNHRECAAELTKIHAVGKRKRQKAKKQISKESIEFMADYATTHYD